MNTLTEMTEVLGSVAVPLACLLGAAAGAGVLADGRGLARRPQQPARDSGPCGGALSSECQGRGEGLVWPARWRPG